MCGVLRSRKGWQQKNQKIKMVLCNEEDRFSTCSRDLCWRNMVVGLSHADRVPTSWFLLAKTICRSGMELMELMELMEPFSITNCHEMIHSILWLWG